MKRNSMIFLAISFALFVMAADTFHHVEEQVKDLRAEVRRLEARR